MIIDKKLTSDTKRNWKKKSLRKVAVLLSKYQSKVTLVNKEGS